MTDPFLPTGALTQAIRNFAKSLESWLTNAMMNIPEEMVRIKVKPSIISLALMEPLVFWAMEQTVFSGMTKTSSYCVGL